MKAPVLTLALNIILIFGALQAFGAEPLHSIVIDGASSLTAAVQPSAIEFAKNQKVGISVHNQGSKAAMECLAKKSCHMGFIPTDSLPTEKAEYEIIPFALTGLEIAVGKGAGISALTTAQLQDIFSGKIKNWKDLGGNNMPIEVYRRRESSGIHKHLAAIIKIPSELPELPTATAMLNVFKKSQGAITYVNSGTASSSDYKSVMLNGVAPTLENYKAGTYPLTIKYYIIERRDQVSDPKLKALTEFLMSERSKFFADVGMLIP
jgi:phosphate transport system substrate-binding protein